MHRAPPIAFALCVLLSAGCAGEDGEAGEDGSASIELGTGEVEFEPLASMQNLVLVAGPQGGYHFVANARIQDLDPGSASMPGLLSNPSTQFYVYREDGTRIDAEGPPHLLGYALADDGWYELPSGRILGIDQQLVEEQNLLPAIYSERLRLRVEVVDVDGKSASSETWILPMAASNE